MLRFTYIIGYDFKRRGTLWKSAPGKVLLIGKRVDTAPFWGAKTGFTPTQCSILWEYDFDCIPMHIKLMSGFPRVACTRKGDALFRMLLFPMGVT